MKDINDILSFSQTKNTIKIKDFIDFDQCDEYLKRFYQM